MRPTWTPSRHEGVHGGITLKAVPNICSRLQPWEEAKPNQTSVPFEKQYFIRDTETPILKQNVGMFRLRNGVEVHFQSFGIFNVSLWDDMLEKFKPLTKKDILFVGRAILLSVSAAPCQCTH